MMENAYNFWITALNMIKKEIVLHVRVDTLCSRINVSPDKNVNLFKNWLVYALLRPENANLLQ